MGKSDASECNESCFQIAECSLSSAKRYKNNFFQKTDRCNYLEYSRDEVLVIYESLLATKKIREIREIRVRLKRIILSVEHESFETKQLIRVIHLCAMLNIKCYKYGNK